MTDLALQLSENGVDLVLEAGDLVLSTTLLEPVLVSLFSDGRAPADAEIPDGTDDPRGWWGEEQGSEWGSLLWLLEREKLTQEVAVRARGYALRALEWLLETDIASTIEVETSIERDSETGEGYLAIRVALERGSSSSWATAWEATSKTDWSASRWRLNLLLR